MSQSIDKLLDLMSLTMLPLVLELLFMVLDERHLRFESGKR